MSSSFSIVENNIRSWAMSSEEAPKRIDYDLEEVHFTLILTKIVWHQSTILYPSRINVCSIYPKIEDIFKRLMMQPHDSNWDEKLWIFKKQENIFFPPLQFELRFFRNEAELFLQLEADIREINAAKTAKKTKRCNLL